MFCRTQCAEDLCTISFIPSFFEDLIFGSKFRGHLSKFFFSIFPKLFFPQTCFFLTCWTRAQSSEVLLEDAKIFLTEPNDIIYVLKCIFPNFITDGLQFSTTLPIYELVSEFICCYCFGIMLTGLLTQKAHTFCKTEIVLIPYNFRLNKQMFGNFIDSEV